MKKTFISKLGIMFTLIFSFLLNFITTSSLVSAKDVAEEVNYRIDVTSISRSDNKITIVTANKLNFKEVTYEYTHYVDEDLISELVVNSSNINVINNTTFSFDVNSDVVGVRVWKIKYQDENGSYPNLFLNGNTIVGNVESSLKHNYVEVTSDKLEKYLVNSYKDIKVVHGHAPNTSTTYESYSYTWYFNLDTDIDSIDKVTVEYHLHEHYEESFLWFTIKNSDTYYPHTSTINSDTVVNDYINGGVRYAIGNTDRSDYNYYVQVLLDDFAPVIQQAQKKWTTTVDGLALIKISYYLNGDYYNDIPVLDENTNWTEYHQVDNTPAFIKAILAFFDWVSNNLWIVYILLAALLIGLLAPLFKIFTLILKGLWYLLKYTIGLPFIIFGSRKEKKESVDKVKKKRSKSIRKHGYNRDKSHFNFN